MRDNHDKGYYFMWRGWMKNPAFERDNVFDRRSAWCWLIEKAAWEDHSTVWNGKTIEIKRGQVPHSFRKMAEAWGWTTSKVQRYIDALKNDTMINTHTDTGFIIITICNYDEYQFNPELADTRTDTDTDTDTDTQTDTNRRNKNKSKTRKNNTPIPPEGDGDDPGLGLVLPIHHRDPCRFDEFWPIFPRKENKKKAKEAYDRARLRDSQDNIIAGAKAYRRQYDADDRADRDRFYKYAQGWLNDDRWRDFTERMEDDDEKPDLAKMTPQQHAEWVMRQMGDA